jgi:hypothetical protein
MRGPGKMADNAGDGRAARLAEALRENLRRRKAQGRAREAATDAVRADLARGGAETGAGPDRDRHEDRGGRAGECRHEKRDEGRGDDSARALRATDGD